MKITITFTPTETITYDEEMLALSEDERYAMLYDAQVMLNSESINQYTIDEYS
jgi:hypothetical protein